jgi:hypothetical protein
MENYLISGSVSAPALLDPIGRFSGATFVISYGGGHTAGVDGTELDREPARVVLVISIARRRWKGWC